MYRMDNQNLNNNPIQYIPNPTTEVPFKPVAWWKVGLSGILYFLIVLLLRSGIGYVVIKNNQSSFSGLSGLALGLVFVNILGIGSVVAATFITGYILKKWADLPKPYITSVLGAILIYVISVVISFLFTEVNQFILIPVVFVTSALSFLLAWKLVNIKVHPVIKIGASLAVLFLVAFASAAFNTYNYEKGRSDEIKNRTFSLYAPDPSYFNKYSIKNSDSITVVYAYAKIETPKGIIHVRQAAGDENLANLFVPPNNCDHKEINDYINVWGKRDFQEPTNKKCIVVYESDDRIVMMADPNDESVLDEAPFVAKINDTFVVFHAYSSSGEFDGTYSEAEKIIVDFVKKSRVIENSEIGL